MKRNIVYIGQEKNIVTQAVEKRLPEAGFDVITLPSDIDEINKHRHSTDIFLCYIDYTSPKAEIVMHYLADLCRDEHRSMCLIVDNATRAQVRKMDSAPHRHERHRRRSDRAFQCTRRISPNKDALDCR
ncbi:MAG: hypothetical protein IKO94_05485 [Selenomonadaceae bacterium]|nr:hypothetical protein [Selenomonadaceae bacterium]